MSGEKLHALIRKPLFIMLAAGFVLKLIYLFVIGPAVFGDSLLIANDAFSYTESFINLVETGEYTHDPEFSPASYGRLPGLAFLWGFFYLLAGKTYAYTALALFQIILDVLAGYMVFKTISKIFNERISLAVLFIYILFPLTFYFVVRTDTEYLSLFMVITVFYKLVFFKPDFKNCLILALLLIAGFYIRETLILLIPLSFIYLLRNFNLKLTHYISIVAVLVLLYLPWPLRNYVKSGEIILIKPLSAGYPEYGEDMISYMYWLYAWNNDDVQQYLVYAYDLEKEILFPDELFSNESEKELALNTLELARNCGTSFVIWQKKHTVPTNKCYGIYDGLISRSFDLLKNNYKVNHPYNYYIKFPMQNLRKAFFKSALMDPNRAPGAIFRITMLFRSVFLVVGVLACLYYRRIDYFKLSFLFFAGICFFTCFILRQVEIRYLFTADVLMLIAAGAFISDLISRRASKI